MCTSDEAITEPQAAIVIISNLSQGFTDTLCYEHLRVWLAGMTEVVFGMPADALFDLTRAADVLEQPAEASPATTDDETSPEAVEEAAGTGENSPTGTSTPADDNPTGGTRPSGPSRRGSGRHAGTANGQRTSLTESTSVEPSNQ